MNPGEMNQRVEFYEYEANSGREPGEKKRKSLYTCWAKVEEVWMKDLEQARQNETESDLTITIRDSRGHYRPTNKHYVDIKVPEFKDNVYNVKQVFPDLQNRHYIKVKAGLDK